MKKLLLLASAVGLTSSLSAQISFTLDNAVVNNVSTTIPSCVVDMNGDFLDDVVSVNNGQLLIDYQNADGSFTLDTFLTLSTSSLWSICAGDYDNNGHNDLLLGDGDYVSFVKADATGSSYTEHQQPDYIFSQRSNFVDIDNDGHLDAFVCHDLDQSHTFKNDGNGNLTRDQSLMPALTTDRGNYSSIWSDYDNDGDLDMYISKCALGSTPGDIERNNLMYQNDGNNNYTEVSLSAGVQDNAQSWTSSFADYNNDGWVDFFTANHDDANRLMINNGDGTFTDAIAASGLPAGELGAWQSNPADFDNDGYVDLQIGVTDAIYMNNGDGTFSLLSGGPAVTVISLCDLNNDGFLDMRSPSNVYMNNTNSNHYLTLNLIGTVSNRNAIGAKVEIFGDGWGRQMREVRSGYSFSPMSSLNPHFGTGAVTTLDSMIIHWPSGLTERWYDVATDQNLEITEGVVSIEESLIDQSVQVRTFPNPTTDFVNLELEQTVFESPYTVSITIYDTKGAVLYNADQVTKNQQTIPVSDWKAGVYIYQVKQGINPIAVGKFAKQ